MTTSKRKSKRNIVLSDRANIASIAMLILLSLCRGISAGVTTYTAVDLYTLTFPAEAYTSGYGFSVWGTHSTLGGNVVGLVGWNGSSHAFMWSAGGNYVDLHPGGFDNSFATSISGGQQAGFGFFNGPTSDGSHALLWSGTNVAIDLNPTGFSESMAYDIAGGQEVGYGSGTVTGYNHHALLWNGTNVATDLNPAGFDSSKANATDGTDQVGFGFGTETSGKDHALLWTNTNSAIDLQPAGFSESEAIGVSGGQQVGQGKPTVNDARNSIQHALLWNGTNAAIDLNPTGFRTSEAYDTNGTLQVGSGRAAGLRFFGETEYALLWNGTNSAINLGTLLPLNFDSSTAYAIDSNGDVFGIASAVDNSTHSIHAIEWIPTVPEPAFSPVLVFTLSLSLRARRRRS